MATKPARKRSKSTRTHASAIAKHDGASAAQSESEERLRATLDNMLEGCQIIGFDWRYLYVNDAVARHGRRAKEELLGSTMMEIYPGIDNTEMFACLRRCMEERIPQRMENEFTYPDGDKAWFELSMQPAPEGVLILSSNITERKRADEALRESEERLRGVMAFSRDLIYKFNLETGAVEYVSPSVHRLTGFTAQEFTALGLEGVASRFHPETSERVETAARSLPFPELETDQVPEVEYRWKRKDGEYRWFHDNRAVVHNEDGRAAAIVGSASDITERKRAEEALQRYEHIVSSTTDMLALVDQRYVYLAANAAYLQAFAKTSDEVIGRTVAEVIGDEVFSTTIRPRAVRCLAGENIHYRAWFEFPTTGRKYMDVTYAPYHGQDTNVHGFVVAARDMTERRHAEEALRAAREELEGRVERRLLQKNPYGLTFREFTVLHHVAAGKADKEIAHELGISPLTVHKHVAHILGKMNAASRTEAAARALREGLLD